MSLLIFDCDGTLVDSQHMIVAAMTAAFADAGLDVPPRQRVLSVVGLSLDGAVQRLLPVEHHHRVAALAENYKSAFGALRQAKQHDEPLYPGIGELIRTLAQREDVMLAMATGKSRRGVAAVLEREGMTQCFKSIQTADDHPSKPHPSMILRALDETGTEARDAVMIGDTTFDMLMAEAAGVVAVGAGWGYHPAEDLAEAGARIVVAESLGLGPALDQLMGQRRVPR